MPLLLPAGVDQTTSRVDNSLDKHSLPTVADGVFMPEMSLAPDDSGDRSILDSCRLVKQQDPPQCLHVHIGRPQGHRWSSNLPNHVGATSPDQQGIHGDDHSRGAHQQRRPLGPQQDAVRWVQGAGRERNGQQVIGRLFDTSNARRH